MANRPADAAPKESRDVLFQSAYGGLPKFALYGFLPFLMLVAGALFVSAVWFGNGIDIQRIQGNDEC